MIQTDTPLKEQLEEAARKRLENKEGTKRKNKEEAVACVRRKVLQDSSSDSWNSVEYDDSTDLESFENDPEKEIDFENIENGRFVVVKVFRKTIKSSGNYVAQIIRHQKKGYLVQFYNRLVSTTKFAISDEPATFIEKAEIVAVLPN